MKRDAPIDETKAGHINSVRLIRLEVGHSKTVIHSTKRYGPSDPAPLGEGAATYTVTENRHSVQSQNLDYSILGKERFVGAGIHKSEKDAIRPTY